MRARRVSAAKSDAFKLTRRGQVLWRDEEIARLEAGEDLLKPQSSCSADEHMSGPDKEKVQERLNTWIAEMIGERLKPLVEMAAAKDMTGLARGIAFRLSESLGVLRREAVAEEMRSLDQPARAQLRGYGVRFGAFNIYFPALLKPASSRAGADLVAAEERRRRAASTPPTRRTLPRPGLTSLLVDPALPEAYYRVAGFHPCGMRAVRIDMLERLADLIRAAGGVAPGPGQLQSAAQGRDGRRRLQGDARHDVDPGLLLVRRGRGAAEAGLPHGAGAASRRAAETKPAGEARPRKGGTGDGQAALARRPTAAAAVRRRPALQPSRSAGETSG